MTRMIEGCSQIEQRGWSQSGKALQDETPNNNFPGLLFFILTDQESPVREDRLAENSLVTANGPDVIETPEDDESVTHRQAKIRGECAEQFIALLPTSLADTTADRDNVEAMPLPKIRFSERLAGKLRGQVNLNDGMILIDSEISSHSLVGDLAREGSRRKTFDVDLPRHLHEIENLFMHSVDDPRIDPGHPEFLTVGRDHETGLESLADGDEGHINGGDTKLGKRFGIRTVSDGSHGDGLAEVADVVLVGINGDYFMPGFREFAGERGTEGTESDDGEFHGFVRIG